MNDHRDKVTDRTCPSWYPLTLSLPLPLMQKRGSYCSSVRAFEESTLSAGRAGGGRGQRVGGRGACRRRLRPMISARLHEWQRLPVWCPNRNPGTNPGTSRTALAVRNNYSATAASNAPGGQCQARSIIVAAAKSVVSTLPLPRGRKCDVKLRHQTSPSRGRASQARLH